ncbi:MAG: hypothetical protein LiPW41_798 [Parcubacteria group bacterium LiPW_41]|nr:MAG: hypothetical protein LiPW41_798 [Parcubacteria group bacterium LiPW_41]
MLNRKVLISYIIKLSIFFLILLSISIGIIVFLRIRIEKIQTTLQENQRLIRSLERRGETISELRKQFEEIKTTDTTIIDAFPYSDDILSTINSIELIANTHGLQIVKQFGTPTLFMTIPDGTKISVIPFSLSLQGNVNSLTKFLSAVESLPYFVSISSASLQSQSTSDWNNISSISLSGSLYTRERE